MEKIIYKFDELPSNLEYLAGGKGKSLARLYQAGYPVPAGFVILSKAFAEDHLRPEAWSQVQNQLDELRAGDSQQSFAIRSSALSEDSEQASFAGEFETRLNLSENHEILEAIQFVHRSRHSEKVQAYNQAKGIAKAHQVAVIVQKLVAADRSGVLFTANPTNGMRTQVMINAAWGLGEAIVCGAVTPDLLVMDKQSKRIVTRHIEQKTIMTVRTPNGTQEFPVEREKQKQAVLSDEEAGRLSDLGIQIECLYGMPMDIEWAMCGKDFYILQARPITAMPDPPPPQNWKLPKGSYMAMRVNIIELMAEPLSPLFETLGLEVVNLSMKDLMTGFLGPDIMPEPTIIQVNHYAYYNGSLKPTKIIKLLFDSLGIAKRMFTRPVERWTEQGRPSYLAEVKKWEAGSWRDLPNMEILQASRKLTKAAIDAYLSMVGGVIPAAWISEAIFTYLYRFLIRRRTEPAAATFLLGFDSRPIQAEKSLYDLAAWARGQEALAHYLSDTPAKRLGEDIQSTQTPGGIPELSWNEWRTKVVTHLERYGHMIFDLDFANPTPADDPAMLLQTCKLFLNGKGVNPYERQQETSEHREAVASLIRNRLKGWRLRQFSRFLALAQRFAPLREDALADVGLAYPIIRQMFQHLGLVMTRAGAIDSPGDIYWLTGREVATVCEKIDQGLPVERAATAIPERKAAIRSAQKASPPMKLPHFSPSRPQRKSTSLPKRKALSQLKGVAASAGRVTGKACVLRGPADFPNMAFGDVLVAKLTTPAWTPLFARAAAIVTDVGGPLSHGSIVAREYGIPAVLGTGNATQLIQDGQTITVDGDNGVVALK